MAAVSLSTVAAASSAFTQPRGGDARLSTTRLDMKSEATATLLLPVKGLPKVGKEAAVEASARSTEAALERGPMVVCLYD